jgi:uncharacterized OB-fold protein
MIRSAPRSGREATPHWKAARDGVLLLPFCSLTGRPVWPPSGACETAGGTLEWRECDGVGVVASFSVVRRPVQAEWMEAGAYVVAMIDLDAGIRMLSNIVDCDPAEIACGARVRATFVATTDPELGLPVFRLDRPDGNGG